MREAQRSPTQPPAERSALVPACPDAAHASRAIEERLRAFATLAERALAENTMRALRSDGRVFMQWCAARRLDWLPASPDTVIAFIEDVGRDRKPATISRYLSSIAMLHAAAELPNPCATLKVKLTRKAHARSKGTRQKQAMPLGEAAIAEITALLSDREMPAPADLRDRALLLVARDTLARASELVMLRWCDLAEADGDGTILIRRSKTDQTGQGAVAWLAPETMAALASWRRAAERLAAAAREAGRAHDLVDRDGNRIAELHQLMFINLDPAGLGPLSTRSVTRIFQRRAIEAGQFVRYSAHSTRVGGAQDLFAAGFDLPSVMQAGRWRSPTQAARYGERLLPQRGAVAQHRRRGKSGSRPSGGNT